MSVNASPFGPKPQWEDANGNPAVGYQLFTYVAGSTSTKLNTYTDSTGGSANTNPIVLNSLGQPTTQIWLTAGQSYKFVLAPPTDSDPPVAPIWTVDNLTGINDTASGGADQWEESGLTPTFVSTVSFTLVGDQTTDFTAGRRLKFTVTAGTVYGTISTAVFGALTTVTMTMDSAQVLDSGLSAVAVALLTPTNVSIPNFITAGSGISITYSSGKPSIAASGQATVNGLFNGGMEVWQRGTSVAVAASTNGYTADRWALTTGANQACTVAQASGISDGSRFAATVQRNNGQTGTGTLVFEQPFELDEIIKWRGQTISVSARIATGANWSPTSGTLTLSIACGTGSAQRRGTTPYTGETTPLTSALTIAAGSSAASFSATASAIIPTNTTQMTLLWTWVPVGTAGAADSFTIDDVMFSSAAGASFERRPFAQELALCQRYFWKTFPYATTPAQNAGTAGMIRVYQINAGATNVSLTPVVFPVLMRTTPTLTSFNPSAANAQMRNTALSADCSATGFGSQNNDASFEVFATGNAGSASGNGNAVHITAAAEL